MAFFLYGLVVQLRWRSIERDHEGKPSIVFYVDRDDQRETQSTTHKGLTTKDTQEQWTLLNV